MPIAPRLQQHHDQVVSLDAWELDAEFPIGPQGAKPKRIVICPNPPPHPFLIGGHRYLFKEPTGSREQQIWSEVIAYEASRTLSVSVPPAFLATASGNGSPGVLVEFFYGHPGDPERRYIHGIERLQALKAKVDLRQGSLRDNVDVCRLQRVPDWRLWWARTLAFDAIIGNTDRHSENWGFLASTDNGQTSFKMAPAFDNGTSLGFIVREADLERMIQPAALLKLIHNGRHHYGWISGDLQDAQHAKLCRRYIDRFTGTQHTMLEMASISDALIERIVEWCVGFEFPVPFSRLRARFVAAQLKGRRDSLFALVGE